RGRACSGCTSNFIPGPELKDEVRRMKDESEGGRDSSLILLPSSFGIIRRGPRFPAQMVRIALIVMVALAAALPAGADIALFTDGRSMKIDAYKVKGETEIQLTLKNGGKLTLPLERVERIVDDEVVPVEIVAEIK